MCVKVVIANSQYIYFTPTFTLKMSSSPPIINTLSLQVNSAYTHSAIPCWCSVVLHTVLFIHLYVQIFSVLFIFIHV